MRKLVLWGDHDARFHSRRDQLFARLPEPKRFATIENGGNLPHEERPKEWALAVRAFLESTESDCRSPTGAGSRPS
jgi:pimeloyl-ACP methyl ester carboxylesterase